MRLAGGTNGASAAAITEVATPPWPRPVDCLRFDLRMKATRPDRHASD
jgi:hypothetical protein